MIGINMEKPKCCLDCPCYNDEFVCCNITGTKSWDLDCFEEVFEDCPLVDDVQPVKHGKWIDKGHFTLMCSCCEHYASRNLLVDYETMNFCPKCGAKMSYQVDIMKKDGGEDNG